MNSLACLGRVLLVALALPLAAFAKDPPLNYDRLERWLRSQDAAVRFEAVQELSRVTSEQSAALLIAALADASPAIRGSAAWALGKQRHPEIPAALRRALTDENDRVRAAAAWALCGRRDRAALPVLLRLAQEDPSGNVRFRTVWGLGIMGDRAALPVAVAALGDTNVSVRERAAINAINALADGTVPARLVKLADHEQPATRRLVLYLFSRYPSRAALPVLEAALRDPDPMLRGEAALTIGRLRARGLGAAVSAALTDPDEHVRGAAAYAVGLLGDQAVRPQLRELLADEAAFVRAIAAESLLALGDTSVAPPAGFRAEELFTFPMFSPTVMDLTN